MDLRELRSWGRHWNEAALERIAAALPRSSPARTWPMLGMLALGLVAGAALGGYAVAQRSQIRRLSEYAHRMGDELTGADGDEDTHPIVVTTHRLNHRRKATTEVKKS
jgi:hypothetical protein